MLSRKLRPAPVARSILVTLGFTLVYITSTLTIWSGSFAFLSGQPDIPGVYDGSSALRSVAFGLTFGVIGLVGMRWHELHRPLPVVAGLLLLTGIGLVWDPANVLAGSMQTTGGMLIGVGMASLFSTWEQIFYEQPEEAVGFEIGVAAIASGVLFLVLTMFACNTCLVRHHFLGSLRSNLLGSPTLAMRPADCGCHPQYREPQKPRLTSVKHALLIRHARAVEDHAVRGRAGVCV